MRAYSVSLRRQIAALSYFFTVVAVTYYASAFGTNSYEYTRSSLYRDSLQIVTEQSTTALCSATKTIMADIEAQASLAADTWGIEVTPFLEPSIATKIEEQFADRADVTAFRVVGGRRLSPSEDNGNISKGEGKRSRFIIIHPDLGLDIGTAESDYCTVIRVENVNIVASNTFPNALASIGVDLDNVGDIVVVDSSTVYLVVDPNSAKQCLRLLSKELVGVGINVETCEDNEFMPDGDIQEMKLSRILERQIERKKLEKGYVQFG